MTLNRLFRILSGSGASWSVPGVDAGAATEGWQDKRAHIARRLGGCFCLGFWPLLHIVRLCRNVRKQSNTLFLRDLLHIAELHHGR